MAKKKRSKKKIILTVVISILSVALVVVIAGWIIVNHQLNKIKRIDTEAIVTVAPEDEDFEVDEVTDDEEVIEDTLDPDEVVWNDADVSVLQDNEIKNILFIGQDAREGEERARSDTMIICSINNRTKEITLVSLMRDMYVPIPGYSANRINSAYKFGDVELLDSTIEEDFGVHIDGNFVVNFEAFVTALTTIGDLDIELTGEEARYMNRTSRGFLQDEGFEPEDWDLQAGMNSLTPHQALSYARIRHIGNADYERTERQRKILIAAFDKMKDCSLSELYDVTSEIFPSLMTDLTNSEIMGYVYDVSTEHMEITGNYRIPVDHSYSCEQIQGMSVLVPNLSTNSEALQEYISG